LSGVEVLKTNALFAVFRFHFTTSVRVGLRAASLQLIVLVALIMIQPEPQVFANQLIFGLATGRGYAAMPLILALWAAGISHLAAREAAHAAIGWHRHLPVRTTDHRRGMVMALVCAQAPLAALWLLLWLAAWAAGAPVRLIYLLSLPWVVSGAAYATSPLGHRWTWLLAWAALIMSTLGSWTLIGIATLCLAAAESLNGEPIRARNPHRAGRPTPPWLMPATLTWRALGWRLLPVYCWAFLPLGASWLFLLNNDVDAYRAGIAVRTGSAVGVILLLLLLADRVSVRRPLSPWIRSLPWSARYRVLYDAAWFALHATPVLASCAWLHFQALLPATTLVVYLSIRLAGALRRPESSITTLGHVVITESILAGLWVGLSAWTAWLLLLLIPFVLQWAQTREQNLRVSVWRERHYLAAGDPSS
jgi:hypothetical protein